MKFHKQKLFFEIILSFSQPYTFKIIMARRKSWLRNSIMLYFSITIYLACIGPTIDDAWMILCLINSCFKNYSFQLSKGPVCFSNLFFKLNPSHRISIIECPVLRWNNGVFRSKISLKAGSKSPCCIISYNMILHINTKGDDISFSSRQAATIISL